MQNINLLIKPASGNCNMRCRYCFYEDETQNREIASFGIMSEETLEALVRRTLETAARSCAFMFQGGEPTLAGLPFYRKLIELVGKYNRRGLQVRYALQTNGYVIDDEWAAFFKEHGFLIGLSLDGTKDLHDAYRIDAHGEGTWQRTLRAAKLMERHGVEFNTLTVITSRTARSIGKIYGFFMRNNLRYQQYIPCLDPLGEERGCHDYSLTPPLYAKFLKTLFDCWYQDRRRGEFVYNRYFENLAGLLLGQPAESCGLNGRCMNQLIVEADGGVYPCDFYVLDRYRLGNLNTDSFEEIDRNFAQSGFLEPSLQVDERCKSCEWFFLCRGGCRRDRDPADGGELTLTYFCESYREFFPYAVPRLCELVGLPPEQVLNRRR
ncbi:MAG: anaerobic sulfatase maturase [Provencibacterium sp.]|nr:anaerobic sulfatase maturase [Provencibacterium sp.]